MLSIFLYNCVQQSITHHGVKEGGQTYRKLQEACFEQWSALITKDQRHAVFALIKQLHPIYSLLACYKFITCLDLQAYKTHYATGLPPTKCFREYLYKQRVLSTFKGFSPFFVKITLNVNFSVSILVLK